MIQIYADGALVYDSRLEGYELQALRITRALNKGGTAEIVMPPYHPAYGAFTGYRTIVEIYRDGKLKFRGRALYPVDDFDNFRTVVCEGELCFFQDAISRPYLYQGFPNSVFMDVVYGYNLEVEPFKRFLVGDVDVTDPNNYIRVESESAEPVLATINKLVERCGGYITFTTDEKGDRLINWQANVGRRNAQIIEEGENLFDFSRSGANTDLATALLPYGAKDEVTGERVTIKSVNNGKDYIVDEEAVALRGTIMHTMTWDDVTDPSNLLKKARQVLNERRNIVTSLNLTALDLSYVDKTVDAYEVGDFIRVVSRARKLDDEFQLTEQTEDLLSPENSYIHLGKEIRTLTGMDVAGDDKSRSDIQKTAASIKQDFDINVQQSIDKALEGTVEELTSMIEQQAGSISLEVSGSLGSKAEIVLTTAGGTQKTAELDLTAIRQAFANDRSSVAISGGVITFNSNTLIVNSTNLQITSDGTIKATNAELTGTATTENGLYKSELSGGRLRFFYDGTEYGGIASDYIEGDTSKRGVTVRLLEDASYMGFARMDPDLDRYVLWYCINFGADISDRTERHLFFGSSYFSDSLTVAGSAYIGGPTTINSTLTTRGSVTLEGAYSLKFKTSNGEYINGLGLSSDNQMVLGSDAYNLYLPGANVYVGLNGGGLVQLQGAATYVTSPCTFYDATNYQALATYNAAVKYNENAFFASGKGVAFVTSTGGSVFALNMTSDKVYVGTQDAPVYVYGSTTQLGMSQFPTTITGSTVTVNTSISIAGAATFNNGYGLLIKNSSGSAQYVLSLNSSNQLSVGNAIFPLYLRGTGVTIASGGLALGQGSVILANGFGLVIGDTSGTSHYVVSLTSGNMVNVGASSYVTYLRGTAVYLASSGAAVTSDRRKKHSVEDLPEAYEAALDKITPVRFKYNDGTSDRYHAGFIAQEVREALEAAGLTAQDFGGYVDLNGDGETLGLIYTEFIAILLKKLQRQEQRLAALEAAR
jgi:hypothetical protein